MRTLCRRVRENGGCIALTQTAYFDNRTAIEGDNDLGGVPIVTRRGLGETTPKRKIADMRMTPSVRKFALTAHVIFSVGWLGAVLAYLPPAITGLTSADAQTVRASYLSMESIAWFVIVPCCFAALLTGLVQSLGTEWGLFRHYWVFLKFLLTVTATIILLLHMPTITRVARTAADMTLPIATVGAVQRQLVIHAAGGLLVLVAATVLSIYKPWGLTPYGRRRLSQAATASVGPTATSISWKLYVLLGFVGLLILLIVLHLIGGGFPHH